MITTHWIAFGCLLLLTTSCREKQTQEAQVPLKKGPETSPVPLSKQTSFDQAILKLGQMGDDDDKEGDSIRSRRARTISIELGPETPEQSVPKTDFPEEKLNPNSA